MEKQWRETAQTIQAGHSKIDDVALAAVNQTMDEIYGECDARYQSAMAEIEALRDRVEACRTTKTASWASITSRWASMDADADAHKTCKDDLCVAEDIRVAKCAERDASAAQSHAAIPTCAAPDASTCGPTADTCESCTVAANDWYTRWFVELDTLITECEEETDNVTQWHSDCQALQAPYEATWCAYKEELNGICSVYSDCYTEDTAAYITYTENLTEFNSVNDALCQITQKVKCWMGAIETCQWALEDVGARESICLAAKANCDAADFTADCAGFTVTEASPAYEAEDPCDTATLSYGIPGDSTWEAQWYNSNNEFHDAVCSTYSQFVPVVTACPAYSD